MKQTAAMRYVELRALGNIENDFVDRLQQLLVDLFIEDIQNGTVSLMIEPISTGEQLPSDAGEGGR